MKESIGLENVERVQLPVHVDHRGRLTALTGREDIAFDIARVFWITDVPQGAVRGAHAHWTCHEVVFAVAGSFDVEVDDGEKCMVVRIDATLDGITVPAGVWCELRNFSPDAVCLVVASSPYETKGYVYDKETWRKGLCK